MQRWSSINRGNGLVRCNLVAYVYVGIEQTEKQPKPDHVLRILRHQEARPFAYGRQERQVLDVQYVCSDGTVMQKAQLHVAGARHAAALSLSLKHV